VVAVVLAACGSGTTTGANTTVTTSAAGVRAANSPISKTLGQGVTAKTVKIGIALTDFKCIAPYIQITRINEDEVYKAFIQYINDHGGIAGRQIVPVFHTFCPIVPAPALSLCTTFTEDDHVFAVMGDFVDLTGQAQPCIANQHKTVLITIDLTQAIIDSSPPGMILGFDPIQERDVSVLLELLARQHTLVGKKVAVLGEATTEKSVETVLVPGLKKMGVKLGSTAILDIAGSDTTAALAQLSSFIEKWKTEHVDSVFLSGLQVSAQQFVPTLVKEMPGVQLLADNTNVEGYGQDLVEAGTRPNPYEGIIAAGGMSSQAYDASANWKYCANVYENYFHKTAPNAEAVIPGPDGHTIDTFGSITDSCSEFTLLGDIGNRVGKYLNDANWVNTVDHYGKIPAMDSLYGSLHTGKYDAGDTFALVAFDSKLPPDGNWRYVTPVEDVPGG
jgi:ABC-type branched-subunit amino acid transport system substrate-binding protein